MAEAQFEIHPSKKMQEVFLRRPYQGQSPEKASLLFLGKDANYSRKLAEFETFFYILLEYHNDGVAFWQNNKDGVHHPFLLKCYPFKRNKDGVRYHSRFAKQFNFCKEQAKYISFVELLDIPTTGNSGEDKDLFKSMINREHIAYLENIFLHGEKKLLVVNTSFIKLLPFFRKRYKCFESFQSIKKAKLGTCIKINENCTCLVGWHFSRASNVQFEIMQKHIFENTLLTRTQ